jgi:hypothetical protein
MLSFETNIEVSFRLTDQNFLLVNVCRIIVAMVIACESLISWLADAYFFLSSFIRLEI